MVPVNAVEWSGWSISSPRPSLEQDGWNLSPPSCSIVFVFSKPSKLCAQEPNRKMQIIQDDLEVQPRLSFIPLSIPLLS
jgi:hypothetical protein